jgi:hypothetical protein
MLGTAEEAGLAAAQAAKVTNNANTEWIATAAAGGAKDLVWALVKNEEKKGKWDLMPTAPSEAGKAAATSAAYVGAFVRQAALAAGTAAGDLKIALRGPPAVGPPETVHTSLEAGQAAALAAVAAQGFARDAVWVAGIAAGSVKFIGTDKDIDAAPGEAAANTKRAVVSLGEQPYFMEDMAAVCGKVARLAYTDRGGISAISAGKAAFEAVASIGATSLQQANAAGTEAGEVVAINPSAVANQAGIQARIATQQNGGKKKTQALMAGMAAGAVGYYKRVDIATAGADAAAAAASANALLIYEVMAAGAAATKIAGARGMSAAEAGAAAAAAARAAVPADKTIPLALISELAGDGAYEIMRLKLSTPAEAGAAAAKAVRAAGGVIPHVAAAAGKAAGRIVMDREGQKSDTPNEAGTQAKLAALAAGASVSLAARAAGIASAAMWVSTNTQANHPAYSSSAGEAARSAVSSAGGTPAEAALVAGEVVGMMYSAAGATTATAASQGASMATAICTSCQAEAAEVAGIISTQMAMEEASVPEVVASEAAQAAQENLGTERHIGTAAAMGASTAAFAIGSQVKTAARDGYDACKLQVYDVENMDLCFLAVGAVVGKRLADDGLHPYDVGKEAARIMLLQEGCPSEVAAEGAGKAIIAASLFAVTAVNVSDGAVVAARAAGGDVIVGIKQAAVAIVTGKGGDTSIFLQAAEAGQASAAAVLSIGEAKEFAIATAGAVAGAVLAEKGRSVQEAGNGAAAAAREAGGSRAQIAAAAGLAAGAALSITGGSPEGCGIAAAAAAEAAGGMLPVITAVAGAAAGSAAKDRGGTTLAIASAAGKASLAAGGDQADALSAATRASPVVFETNTTRASAFLQWGQVCLTGESQIKAGADVLALTAANLALLQTSKGCHLPYKETATSPSETRMCVTSATPAVMTAAQLKAWYKAEGITFAADVTEDGGGGAAAADGGAAGDGGGAGGGGGAAGDGGGAAADGGAAGDGGGTGGTGTSTDTGISAAPLATLEYTACTGDCRPWCPFEVDDVTKAPVAGRWGYCDGSRCEYLLPGNETNGFIEEEWNIPIPFTFITGAAARSITTADTLFLLADSVSAHSRILSYKWTSITPQRLAIPKNYYKSTVDLTDPLLLADTKSDDQRGFVVVPFMLEACNVYEFRVSVSEADFQYSRANASVEVTVVPGAVEAYIEGGDRTITNTLPMVLDATKHSKDRDIPSSGVQALQFVWSCHDYGTGADICKTFVDGEPTALDLLSGDLGVLRFSSQETKGMVLGEEVQHKYRFTVEVTAEVLGGCYPTRKASATVDVTLKKPQLALPVVRLDGKGRLTKVSASKSLVLQGHVESEEQLQLVRWIQPTGNGSAPTALVDWSTAIMSPREVNSLAAKELCCVWDNKCCMLTGEYSLNLVIKPSVLVPGKSYTFALEAIAEEDQSVAALTVIVNAPPVNGSISIRPSCGYALGTKYFSSAVYWVDDAEDLPLLYKFAYLPGGADGEEMLLSPFSEQYWLDQLLLPEGRAANNMLTVRSYISDRLEATTTAEAQVRNLPPIYGMKGTNAPTAAPTAAPTRAPTGAPTYPTNYTGNRTNETGGSKSSSTSHTSTDTGPVVLRCEGEKAGDRFSETSVDLPALVATFPHLTANALLLVVHAVGAYIDDYEEAANTTLEVLVKYAQQGGTVMHDSPTAHLRQAQLMHVLTSKGTLMSTEAQRTAVEVIKDIASSFSAPDIIARRFYGAAYAGEIIGVPL